MVWNSDSTQMFSDNNPKFSLLRRIWIKIRHGLVFQTIKNKLMKIGIEVLPYYWVQEGVNIIEPPRIKGNEKEFSTEFLDVEDIIKIGSNARGYPTKNLLDNLKNGKKCYSVKHNQEVVAFMWIDFEECNFEPNKMILKKNEVYIFSVYTMESFRGLNIAPYMVFNCYQTLRKMGYDAFYSVSEYFNKSAIRYKNKLGSKNLKLMLYIRLFKKLKFYFVIRTFK